MKSTSIAPLRLDARNNTNWNIDAQPVAILNEASTLHERLAYCWGLARGIEDLSELLCGSKSEDVARTSGFFTNQIAPLVAMLERMAADTRLNEKRVS
ncbi:hypothetical protein [Polaromonas hydrogenivorans]|uniref:DUF3077 domain-containing protein n=1 Tax=Polaromonas hydrogenivorans TaxID=335476 RepID=A0AAU7LPE6_9BURK